MASHRQWRWLAVPAILLFFYLALNSLRGDSPTIDEQNHLARGLAYLRTGDPRLSVEHPPLVNVLSAVPLLTMPQIELPLEHASWQREPEDIFWYVFAEEMLWQANRDLDIQKILFLARLPVVFMTIGLALVGWRFAHELWGGVAPLLVLIFLLFDPNILAHGRYVTTDIGGTLFVLLATYLLWRLWRLPGWSWRAWLAAALGMGLAFSSKLSALVFVPIWAVQALFPLYGHGAQRRGNAALRRIFELFSAGLLGAVVVWAVFGFEWGNFLFLDPQLAGFNALRGPMPTFWSGIERILLLSGGGRPAFMLGEFSSSGFPLYFPLALAVKTPLATLVLFVCAAVALMAVRPLRSNVLFLLLPIFLYMAVSIDSALNIGYRHLLPILPFVYLVISGFVAPELRYALGERYGYGPTVRYAPLALGFFLVLSLLIIDGRIHPHYLSTFNSLGGGPENGHRLLVDSNIDWGQDLLRLRHWTAENEITDLKLGWFGTADPDYYGLDYQALPGFPRQPFWGQWTTPPFSPDAPEPGTYAISVSSLWELPLAEKNVYPWFRAREPDERIGYSIFIYEVR